MSNSSVEHNFSVTHEHTYIHCHFFSLWATVRSYIYFPVLHSIILFICSTILKSQSISSHPLPPWQPQVYILCLWVYFCFVFMLCLFVCFFRFHIWAISYGIFVSLSGLLHLEWHSPGASMLLQMALCCRFLWLSSIPLYKYTTSSLSVTCWWTFRLFPGFCYCK